MDVVFLDQNKWIELAGVEAGNVCSGPLVDLYDQLTRAVESGRVVFPLTVSHILETSKRNDLRSRAAVVAAQAKLSKGLVYRSRTARLRAEMRSALVRLFRRDQTPLPEHWAIAPGFVQAFEPMDEMAREAADIERVRRFNALIDPRMQYVDYMLNQDDARRRAVHAKLSMSAAALVERIETRRARLAGETVDLRRRAYCAQLFIDHQDEMIRMLHSLGYSMDQFMALGAEAVVALIEDVPTLKVEAEISARLEASMGKIKSTDVFDMASFYTAIPYSTHVIGEKKFVALARQAKLHVRYPVLLSESLTALLNLHT